VQNVNYLILELCRVAVLFAVSCFYISVIVEFLTY